MSGFWSPLLDSFMTTSGDRQNFIRNLNIWNLCFFTPHTCQFLNPLFQNFYKKTAWPIAHAALEVRPRTRQTDVKQRPRLDVAFLLSILSVY